MREELLWDGVRLRTDGSFPIGTDSLALADFAVFRPDDQIADLGCGCGTLGLLTLAKYPSALVTGIEISPQAAALARENAASSRLSGRFTVLEGDLRRYRELLPANSFSGVIANPPYYPESAGRASRSLPGARSEQSCTLFDLCRCASWLLRFGGSFSLVHRPERLADLCCALRECRLEPKRLRLVRHRAGAAPSLVLLESRLGGRPGLCWLDDLILYNPDGSESAEARRIYHREDPK
jgi:tRNA1Val (adenine37-N6)-methyltransferase